jgi:uncharacterized protein (TIGR02145 family)
MNKLLLFKMIFFFITLAQAQKISEVKIGKQIWMQENLNVSNFRNGDKIIEAKSEKEWKKALKNNIPAFCYYLFDSTNINCGKFYNYFVVTDPRLVTPEGWHIPSVEEWSELVTISNLNEEKIGYASADELRSKSVEFYTSEHIHPIVF